MMNSVGLRKLRKWVIFISTINVLLMTATYILYAISVADHQVPGRQYYFWQDWVTIILTTAIFFSSIYALKGKPFLHKYLRAFLMLFLATFKLGLNFKVVDNVITIKKLHPDYQPFSCVDASPQCYTSASNFFISIFVGFSLILEIVWTLKCGPLDPKATNYGVDGYNNQANVIYVSPDQPNTGNYMVAPGKIDAPPVAPIVHNSMYQQQLPQQQQQQPYFLQPPMAQQQPVVQQQPMVQQQLVVQPNQPPQFNRPYIPDGTQPYTSQPYSPQPFVP